LLYTVLPLTTWYRRMFFRAVVFLSKVGTVPFGRFSKAWLLGAKAVYLPPPSVPVKLAAFTAVHSVSNPLLPQTTVAIVEPVVEPRAQLVARTRLEIETSKRLIRRGGNGNREAAGC
jgi:hypothetical protein